MIIKIVCIGLVTIITSAIIKQYRQDMSLLVSICGGLIISLMCLGSLAEIIDSFSQISSNVSLSTNILLPITKIIGIGYITEFCASSAEDAGNKVIGSKIMLGGKIAICLVAIPIVKNMLFAIFSLVSNI